MLSSLNTALAPLGHVVTIGKSSIERGCGLAARPSLRRARVAGDTMAEVVGQLFRLPANGKPMTVMQLAGFPSEVVD